jgi:hypothetical protein
VPVAGTLDAMNSLINEDVACKALSTVLSTYKACNK